MANFIIIGGAIGGRIIRLLPIKIRPVGPIIQGKGRTTVGPDFKFGQNVCNQYI